MRTLIVVLGQALLLMLWAHPIPSLRVSKDMVELAGHILDRKASYTLSYSHDALLFEALHARLLQHRSQCVSHTIDAFTKTTAAFSGIEVKPSDRDKLKAEYQLSI